MGATHANGNPPAALDAMEFRKERRNEPNEDDDGPWFKWSLQCDEDRRRTDAGCKTFSAAGQALQRNDEHCYEAMDGHKKTLYIWGAPDSKGQTKRRWIPQIVVKNSNWLPKQNYCRGITVPNLFAGRPLNKGDIITMVTGPKYWQCSDVDFTKLPSDPELLRQIAANNNIGAHVVTNPKIDVQDSMFPIRGCDGRAMILVAKHFNGPGVKNADMLFGAHISWAILHRILQMDLSDDELQELLQALFNAKNCTLYEDGLIVATKLIKKGEEILWYEPGQELASVGKKPFAKNATTKSTGNMTGNVEKNHNLARKNRPLA
ncbi:expressed unknown protein [Seminavis robusta]|uniref:Uncharacterized protein n=1 Tax=Seminavis robusta TaxID=568900 RepID=A0A9N8E3C1_9STRA|nr:expressed unknown protein [Seminavis robusta]|eukprot:Sro512_g157670.1 n/a (319) ;mRNA; r:38083-39039